MLQDWLRHTVRFWFIPLSEVEQCGLVHNATHTNFVLLGRACMLTHSPVKLNSEHSASGFPPAEPQCFWVTFNLSNDADRPYMSINARRACNSDWCNTNPLDGLVCWVCHYLRPHSALYCSIALMRHVWVWAYISRIDFELEHAFEISVCAHFKGWIQLPEFELWPIELHSAKQCPELMGGSHCIQVWWPLK